MIREARKEMVRENQVFKCAETLGLPPWTRYYIQAVLVLSVRKYDTLPFIFNPFEVKRPSWFSLY